MSKISLNVEELKDYKIPTGVLAVSGSVDPGALLAACMDGGIYQVELASGNYHKISSHNSYASGVACMANPSPVVISAGYDGHVKWSDYESGETIHDQAAHSFWSWNMKMSRDARWVGSVSGQYLSGGYKYEPAPAKEPTVRIYHAESGESAFSHSLLPPVLSLAFSPDNQLVSAANMMGDIKVWSLQTGDEIASWNSPDFTSWGIIKSHHYIGGIFDQCFSPDSKRLVACGMGPMRDPMAGNGKQTWQVFDLEDQSKPPVKVMEVKDDQRGRGLMESIAFHPDGKFFVMAGRLAQGQWNIAFFDASSGELIHSINNKTRITSMFFDESGEHLHLGGAVSQGGKKDGEWKPYGRLHSYKIQLNS